MSLSTEADAVILSRDAAAAFLIELIFESKTERIWTGFGKLKTLDAKEWDGVGKAISLGGLAPSFNTSAPSGKLGASGVSSEVLASALVATEYRDQPLIIYLQPFQDRALYGSPVPIATRLMKTMEFTRDEDVRAISVNHEGPYTGRRRPAAAWFSDSDQQKRHPGDKYCERVPYYRFRRTQWPHYT